MSAVTATQEQQVKIDRCGSGDDVDVAGKVAVLQKAPIFCPRISSLASSSTTCNSPSSGRQQAGSSAGRIFKIKFYNSILCPRWPRFCTLPSIASSCALFSVKPERLRDTNGCALIMQHRIAAGVTTQYQDAPLIDRALICVFRSWLEKDKRCLPLTYSFTAYICIYISLAQVMVDR